MKLRKSSRKKSKIKMALQGSSGSGKTYSALLLAKGMLNGDISKAAIIDTENGSADLYANLGEYSVLTLDPPYSPSRYMEAIDACLDGGAEVIIIDSITHCWEYLLEVHSDMPGNSFKNWRSITPLHNKFINKILQSPCHFISTIRTKQDYVLNEDIHGKKVPEKVGLKSVQRDGIDYEFTLVFDIDIKHMAKSSKDRTGIFTDDIGFKIDENTGKRILEWCNTTVKRTIDDEQFKKTTNGTIYQIENVINTFELNEEQLKTLKAILEVKNEELIEA